MKKYILSALAIASALFAGCNKNEVAPSNFEGSRTVKVTAALEATKVGVTNDYKYQWEAGDVIGVWTGAEFTPFTVDASSVGTGVGVFTGTLPDGGVINDASVAVYPYNAPDAEAEHLGDTLEGSVYTSNYNDNNWDYKPCVPLYAKATASVNGSSVADFKFGILSAAAKLTIKNIPAEAKLIFLEAPQRILLGTGSADLSAEYPKLAANMSNFDYAFIVLPEHSEAIAEYTAIIPIVTGEYADPVFRFTLFNCDMDNFDWGGEMDKATYNHKGNLNTGGYINRGDLFVLPTVTF